MPKNVIYTFDYFVPQKYFEGRDEMKVYPGTYACNRIAKGWVPEACKTRKGDEMVGFNRQWHVDTLEKFPVRFMRKYDVPMFLN